MLGRQLIYERATLTEQERWSIPVHPTREHVPFSIPWTETEAVQAHPEGEGGTRVPWDCQQSGRSEPADLKALLRNEWGGLSPTGPGRQARSRR